MTTLTPSLQDVALSTLLEEFPDAETQRLVRGAIERALSQGRRLDEVEQERRDINEEIRGLRHIRPIPCIDRTHDCPRCQAIDREASILKLGDRQRLLLMGKAVAA